MLLIPNWIITLLQHSKILQTIEQINYGQICIQCLQNQQKGSSSKQNFIKKLLKESTHPSSDMPMICLNSPDTLLNWYM